MSGLGLLRRDSAVEQMRMGFQLQVALFPAMAFTFSLWMPGIVAIDQNPMVIFGVPVLVVLILLTALVRNSDIAWIAIAGLTAIPVLYVTNVHFLPDGALAYGAVSACLVTALAATRRQWAFVIALVVYSAFQWSVLLNPLPQLLLGASVVNGVPILLLYQIATAIGVHLAYRTSMEFGAAADLHESQREALLSSRPRFASARELQLRATQRLHETVLNTLRAISRHADGDAPELATRMGADMLAIEEWDDIGLPSTLSALVRGAADNARRHGLQVEVLAGLDVVLSPENADAIAAILAELLENVRRHAHAQKTTIGWRSLDERRLVLWVQDDGVGIRLTDNERLGFRHVVRDTAASMEGQVVVSRLEPGTRVTVRLRVSPKDVPSTIRQFSLELPQTVVKVIAQAWLIFSIVATPLVVARLDHAVPLGLSIMLVVASMLYASIRWVEPPQWVLAVAPSAMAALLLVAFHFASTCSRSEALQWMVNFLIAVSLLALTFGTWKVRGYVLVVALGAPLYVLSQMDPACSYYVRLPTVTMLFMLPTSWLFLRGLQSGAPEREELAADVEHLAIERLRLEQEADSIRIRWSESLAAARDVMERLQVVGAIDAPLRRNADVADARLRAQLVIDPAADGALAAFALACVERAALAGIAISTQILDVAARQEPLPDEIQDIVHSLIDAAAGDGMLKLFVVGDEMTLTLVLPVVAAEADALRSRWHADQEDLTVGDCALTVEPQEPDAEGRIPMWLSLTRPTAPSPNIEGL